MNKRFLIVIALILLQKAACFGFTVMETPNCIFSVDAYLRTDISSFRNVVTLDNSNKDDRTTYFGIDYSLGFRSEFKEDGPVFYLMLERNGPYDYNAPLFIHNTLMVAGPSYIKPYRNEELLPQIEEFWADLPVASLPLRFKVGLFPYEVGKGFVQGCGSFENYGFTLYNLGDKFNWRFHYYRPDFVNKNILGPKIDQEIEQGVVYEPNAANYFAFDAEISRNENTFQPFIGLLLDNTSSGKRTNYFAAPAHREILGTIGLDYDVNIKDLSIGIEVARNFGRAKSESPLFKDVEHKGYLLYANSSYTIGKFSPHAQFLYSSGNKVTKEMVENGDELFPGSSNKAFSIYSPLNVNLFDSHCPSADSSPFVFFGWSYGINYGVGLNRPSTMADVAVLENLVMPSLGFDYDFTDKLSVTLDWWYIMANEKGVGMLGGMAKELSRDLGHEIDLTFSYEVNENIYIELCSGYFFPGRYFREKRDDVDGSLFTPYVRGDGKADGAYQIELSFEFEF